MNCVEVLLFVLMKLENLVVLVFVWMYLGGCLVFVLVMNVKVKFLGMNLIYYMELIGLYLGNIVLVCDLGILVNVVFQYGLICQFLIIVSYDFNLGYCVLKLNNINVLVCNGGWNINILKIGFINEVGCCVVMYIILNNCLVVVVLLGVDLFVVCINDVMCLMNWVS